MSDERTTRTEREPDQRATDTNEGESIKLAKPAVRIVGVVEPLLIDTTSS